jgi:beta-glucosidase
MVLLRNEGLLPLSESKPLKIAVIGPNADDAQAQMGDWAGASGQVGWIADGHPRACSKTVLDGIRHLAPEGSVIRHARGADIAALETDARDDYDDGQARRKRWGPAKEDPEMIAEAVRAAEASDVVVLVLGDMKHFFGECRSTATLELPGGQKALARAVAAVGKPVIVVLINSKPLVLPEEVQSAAAVIEAFSPGMAGGTAIAEILFGRTNPSGRLTISIPRHAGQQPVYYSQVRGQHGDRYADLTQDPLFVFGEGLSYTTFAYSDLKVLTPEVDANGTACCSVTLANTGDREGVEVAQLYISDLVTSATWVNRELKAYQRVSLGAGESREILFEIPVSALSLVNAAGERVVEPGEFEFQVGGSSRDRDLLKAVFTVTA